MYNSIVLICSEITSQKKIHLTIFFYLSIKKALEDFLHDNRDSSHKHTEAMRLYAPSLKLLYRFSSPQGDISVLACIYSVPQLPICHLTQKYLSTNIKVAPLTYNIPVSVKRCFSERMFLSFSSKSSAVTLTPAACYRLDQFI